MQNLTSFESQYLDALKRKGKTPLTQKAYIAALRSFNGKQPISSPAIFNDIEDIDAKLERFKPNTRRNKYIAIASLLSQLPEEEALYAEYSRKLKDINTTLKSQEAKHEKSEAQEANWIEWSEVKEKWDALKKETKDFKKIRTLDYDQYYELLKFVILSLYYLQPPRRNKDYVMTVIKNVFESPAEMYEKSDEDNINYLNLDRYTFIFNDYKTRRKSGSQSFDIPPELQKVINLYLYHHPSISRDSLKLKSGVIEVPFLVHPNGVPINPTNGITYILNSIFQKRIGSSMLRHIYLTHKFGKVDKERKEIAEKMAHSVSMATDYIKE